jgi:hypothetical protein
LVFHVIGLLAIYGVFAGAQRRRDGWPFAMTVLFFLACSHRSQCRFGPT